MGRLKFIRNQIDKIINNFNCWLNGHCDVVIIEEYEPTIIAKNYISVGRKIIFGPKYIQTNTLQKRKCRVCGRIYLVNVKVNDFQYIP